MRKCIFMAVCLLVTLVGCKEVKVDVKMESFTNKSENWSIDASKSVFSSTTPEMQKSCDVINNRVQQLLDSLQQNIKTEADTFFTSYAKESSDRPAFSYELYMRDSVFMATDKFISLRLTVYTYEGGAHGRTNFFAFNYDVKRQMFLTAQEIIDYSKSVAVDTLLVKNFDNKGGCFSEKPTLKVEGLEAINVSPVSVCFTYGHYVLGAYACGYAQVSIPMAEMKKEKALLINF